MRIILIVVLLMYSEARTIPENCDGIIIDNYNYERDVLKEDLRSPYQLVIDYDTNMLFFSYSAHTDEIFKSAYINLKTNEFGTIPGIAGGFANAVDSKSHKVYLGGRDGIYEFDYNNKSAVHLGVPDHNVWQMFYKDKLYYTTYPDETVYIFNEDDKTFKNVDGLRKVLVNSIAVDKEGNVFYSNDGGLFMKTEEGDAHKLGELNVNGFSSNIKGDLYFSTSDAIYAMKNNTVEKKATFHDLIYGVAIESDGSIIYANENSIIRLKSTGNLCVQTENPLINGENY